MKYLNGSEKYTAWLRRCWLTAPNGISQHSHPLFPHLLAKMCDIYHHSWECLGSASQRKSTLSLDTLKLQLLQKERGALPLPFLKSRCLESRVERLCLASLIKGKYWRLIYLQVAHEREVWVRSAHCWCASPTTRYHFCVRLIDQRERPRPHPLPSAPQMGVCANAACTSVNKAP